MIYLLPRFNPIPKYDDCFGLLNSPRAGIIAPIKDGITWAFDNNVFTMEFNIAKWTKGLERYQEYLDTCLFAVAPDFVGDKERTLERFEEYQPTLKDMGYPVALATQDGMTTDDIPWQDIDAIFVGGSVEHKMSEATGDIIKQAIAKSIHVHIGRVNSRKRLMRFWFADSVDGTSPAFGPNINIPPLAKAVREARALKERQACFIPHYI